mgnify:CR=1 FL=1
MQALFGNEIIDLRYYWLREMELDGIPLIISRTGWSSELGYEIYLRDGARGTELWDKIMSAGAPFGPTHQFEKQVPFVPHRLLIRDLTFLSRALDQVTAQCHVSGGHQQLAYCVFAIPSGSASFLVVSLYRVGRRQMYYATHVVTIDAHAEGVGGDDDLNPVLDEIALDLVAIRSSHAGVIGCCPPAGILEADGFLFGDLAGRGIYDGGAGFLVRSAEGFGPQRVDLLAPLGAAADLSDPQCEVGAGKAAQQLRGVSGQSEAFEDCLLYTSPSPRDGLLSRMPSSA